ncbi:DeoR family transcriptional regulator, partial [Sinorhizobium meliloti]
MHGSRMSTDLLLRERKSLIQERLRTEGRVLAVDLAREFGVSEDTIRRDLREMAAAGLCERVYGG